MKLLQKIKKQTEINSEANTENDEMNDIISTDTGNPDEDNIVQMKQEVGKKGKLLIIAIIALMVLGMIISFARYSSIKQYQHYDVVSSVDTSGDNIADYSVFAGNVLKITKDGASYIDEKGIVKWDVSYAMKMPKAKVCGDYAIVADMNGKDVYVFNIEGEVSRQKLNYDIANVDVAEQGVYCLVLIGEDCNYIKGYDKDSNDIYELKVSIDKSGYPLDVDISNDGQKLVASYSKIEGTKIVAEIVTYNFGSVGKNENADRMMGSYTMNDALYPIVRFLDNDTIAAFGDKDIRLYDMVEKPKEKAIIDLKGKEMQGIFGNSSYLGFISLAEDGASSKYKIYIYDTNGNEKSAIKYSDTYKKIYATEEELIVLGEMDCSILRFNGSTKFHGSFDKNIINIVPDSNKEEYVVIFENETKTITLK